MIHRTTSSWQPIEHKDLIQTDNTHLNDEDSWQYHLQQAITDPAELLHKLNISDSYLQAAIAASQKFSLRVPLPFLSRMQKGDINDPLLQQVLPVAAELESVSGYSNDPVGELSIEQKGVQKVKQDNNTSGLIQKYHGRVLLMVNGHCAINCRYCFRRHFPYADHKLNKAEWQNVIKQVAEDPTINEVIYSGGDPLASNDKQLQWLTQQITTIPHVQRLRIHTRLPVVIPQRITSASLAWMTEHRLTTVVVLHINHANEIDESVSHACQKLKAAGITLLNQAVLLKGINDTVDSQAALSERLINVGVIPYYLHILDKVDGAAHFDHTREKAIALHQRLTKQLSGYMVPKLVQERAGEASKTLIYT